MHKHFKVVIEIIITTLSFAVDQNNYENDYDASFFDASFFYYSESSSSSLSTSQYEVFGSFHVALTNQQFKVNSNSHIESIDQQYEIFDSFHIILNSQFYEVNDSIDIELYQHKVIDNSHIDIELYKNEIVSNIKNKIVNNTNIEQYDFQSKKYQIFFVVHTSSHNTSSSFTFTMLITKRNLSKQTSKLSIKTKKIYFMLWNIQQFFAAILRRNFLSQSSTNDIVITN